MARWKVEADREFEATLTTLKAEALCKIFHEAEQLAFGPGPETATELLDSRIETHVVKLPNINHHLLLSAVADERRIVLLGVGSSNENALIGQVRAAARRHFSLVNPTIEQIRR